MTAAFATYFCMYAFRKPFAVGMYSGQELWDIDFKIVLIISQVLGYTLSKFCGIKVVSEMKPGRRIVTIALLIAVAEAALILFGVIPAPWNFWCLFLNGLPLGMVWGLVFSFLEGRQATEMLGAGLCCSFILASGVVKSVGKWLMVEQGVTEYWMPAATGAVFVVPLIAALWMLSRVPAPSGDDVQHRAPREPMDHEVRRAFFRQLAAGIMLLVAIYAIIGAYRDFRDNFAVELWAALGYEDKPGIFTLSEVPIAVLVFAAASLMVLIRDNQRAFRVGLGSVFLGAGIVAGATAAFEAGALDPAWWFIAVGLGTYLPYIAFHVMVFDRLIALLRRQSNVGYLMYLSDAIAYLASIGIVLYKNFGAHDISWLDFFIGASYATAAVTAGLCLAAFMFFRGKTGSAA